MTDKIKLRADKFVNDKKLKLNYIKPKDLKLLLAEFCEEQIAELKKELEAQIEKMKKYIKACWVEENLNDYSSYITNTSDEFRDLVKEINDEVRNGR